MERKVKIQFTAETEQFGTGVRKAAAELDHFAERAKDRLGLSGLTGGFSSWVTMIGAAVTNVVNQAQKALELTRRAAASGFGVNQLTAMDRFTGDRGFSSDAVLALSGRLKLAQGEALRGNRELRDAFAELGVTGQDLERSLAPDLFVRVAQSMESGAVSATKYAAAAKVLGESFRQAAPMLQAGLGSTLANAGGREISGSHAILSAFGSDLAAYWSMIKGAGGAAARGIGGASVAFGHRMWGGAMAGVGSLASLLGFTGLANKAYGSSDMAAERVYSYMAGGDMGESAAQRASERLAQVQAAKAEREKIAGVLGEKNVQALEELNFERQSLQDRRTDLQRRKDALRLQLQSATDPVAKQEIFARMIEAQKGIDDLTPQIQAKLQAEGKAGKSSSPLSMGGLNGQTDALARIGLFRGGAINNYRSDLADLKRALDNIATRIETSNRLLNQ